MTDPLTDKLVKALEIAADIISNTLDLSDYPEIPAVLAAHREQKAQPDCLRCNDCGRPYSKGPDLVVSDVDWERICPEGGVLCPNCMNDRFELLGVPAGSIKSAFKSGPFAVDTVINPAQPSGDVGELIKELQDIASEDEYENYMRRLAHRCIDEITRLQAECEKWKKKAEVNCLPSHIAERRGIERAVEWHQQRRNETPDAFEMEFHENSAKAILALEPSS